MQRASPAVLVRDLDGNGRLHCNLAVLCIRLAVQAVCLAGRAVGDVLAGRAFLALSVALGILFADAVG